MRTSVVACVLAALGALAGCAGASSGSHSTPPPDLVASVTQFRPDEGTNRLHAGVTNRGGSAVTVTAARVLWSGFVWSPVRLPARPVPGGQTAAFLVRYGAPRCTGRPGAPYLEAVVDGRPRRLPLHVDLPGLLERLRDHACAEQRLAAAARLSLRLEHRTVRRHGQEVLPGAATLVRRHGPAEQVTVVDLGGSVLFDVLAAQQGALPARLAPDDDSLRLPVVVRPAGRCDGHARGQSSQTFLFSVYTRLGGEAPQRTIFVPSRATRQRLLDLLDRACGAAGPTG